MIKYEPDEPLVLDYDKLFIIPTKHSGVSLPTSKEEWAALIEKLKECGC